MNSKPPSWERLAQAARQMSAPPSDEPRQIPWLPDLEPRVRAIFLRLLWRSAALWAVLIACAILAFTLWAQRSAPSAEDAAPHAPNLPLPPLP
jgi:hypothetical protein